MSVLDLLNQAIQNRCIIYRYNDYFVFTSTQKGFVQVHLIQGLWVILHSFDLSLWKLEEVAEKVEAWDQFPKFMLQRKAKG